MKGIVTLEARNKETLALENTVVKDNIITDTFIARTIRGDTRIDMAIHITKSVFAPSFFTYNTPSDAIRPIEIPNVPRFQFFSKTADSDAFIQISARFNPPDTGTTRTISTVLLTGYETSGSFESNQGRFQPRAFTTLDVPCIQTDTQVYDIYYRIYFQYDEAGSSIAYRTYEDFLQRLGGGYPQQNTRQVFNRSWTMPWPPLQVRPSDVNKYAVSTDRWYPYRSNASEVVTDTLVGYKCDRSWGFDTAVGTIVSGIYYNSGAGVYFPVLAASDYSSDFNKIQNLIGNKVELTTIVSPFLNVDNLPDSTGKITLGGEWNDAGPVNGDYYQYVALPEWNKIQIVESGAVGVAKYKYTTQKYLGGANEYRANIVPGLSHYHNLSRLSDGLSLLGDLSDAKFGVQQLSATIAYDDSSVLVPKTDQIILYSISASKYWHITGGFTNIHQLAVRNGIVYIACRNTGLWRVDPRVTTVATKVTVSTSITVNFSKCHGVSVCGKNKLWAVADDALVSYDGSAWTAYNATTTPAFGNTATVYSNIEYISSDPTGNNGEMLVVRANGSAATTLGWWWSQLQPLTEILNGSTAGTAPGNPRLNRSDLVCLGGVWAVYIRNAYYLIKFGESIYKNLSISVNSGYPQVSHLISPVAVTTSTAQRNLLVFCEPSYPTSEIVVRQRFFDPTGAYLGGAEGDPSIRFFDLDGYTDDRNPKSAENNSRAYHCNILLAHGLVFSIKKIGYINGDCVLSEVIQVGLDRTPHGGSTRWAAIREYGWDGSKWVLGGTTGRTTHSDARELLDGVTVKFADGASGTSFLTPNYWKFGLCRGLLKDNATRVQLVTPFYVSKNLSGNAPLSETRVPATSAGQTGVVGVNVSKSTAWVTPDADGHIKFAGQNGWQYAVGDKYLVGDFELSIDTSKFADPKQRQSTSVGIGRISRADPRPLIEIVPGFSGQPGFGIYITNGGHGGTKWGERVYFATNGFPTTLSIRRTAGVITVVSNGTVIYTYPQAAYIRACDDKLEVIFTTVASNDPMPVGLIAPKATIISNGSTRAVHIGDPVAQTESYSVRFKGVDTTLPPTGTLNGQPVNVKTDGTRPVPGEITLDAYSGIAYFNAADVGKTVTLNCTRVFH